MSDNPTCPNCSVAPVMERMGDTHPGDSFFKEIKVRPGTSHMLNKTGHPHMALVATALSIGKWTSNNILAYFHYKCPSCGHKMKTGLKVNW